MPAVKDCVRGRAGLIWPQGWFCRICCDYIFLGRRTRPSFKSSTSCVGGVVGSTSKSSHYGSPTQQLMEAVGELNFRLRTRAVYSIFTFLVLL